MNNIKEIIDKQWICPKCGKEHSFNTIKHMDYPTIKYDEYCDNILVVCIRCRYNERFDSLDNIGNLKIICPKCMSSDVQKSLMKMNKNDYFCNACKHFFD